MEIVFFSYASTHTTSQHTLHAYYSCVLILLYMCPHTNISVLVLLYSVMILLCVLILPYLHAVAFVCAHLYMHDTCIHPKWTRMQRLHAAVKMQTQDKYMHVLNIHTFIESKKDSLF
jgi:hypothetical protein